MLARSIPLILASASPRRAGILRDAGIPFEIKATDVNETARSGESAKAMVARLAEAKARAVASQLRSENRDCIVIGADTAVELDGEIFGKPRDAAHARGMLASLSGRTHQVHTGIFVARLAEGVISAGVETTLVTFAALSYAQIEAYVAGGEPFDKAGGYAIQGRAGRFITTIEGCYFNVVGLPLARLCGMLREVGWPDEE